MTITVVSAVSFVALLGISGLFVMGRRLAGRMRSGRFPLLAIPVSLPFILLNLVLAFYFAGMAGDSHAGAVDSAGRVAVFVWAIPAAAAAVSVLWFIVLDIRTIFRRE